MIRWSQIIYIESGHLSYFNYSLKAFLTGSNLSSPTRQGGSTSRFKSI
jgi:hypothetical protein